MVLNTQGNDSPTDNSESVSKNGLVSRIEQIEEERGELKQEVEEIKEDRGELKQEVEELKEDRGELKQEVEELTEEKDELRQDVEELTEEKDELRQDVEKQSERINELEGQKDELEQTVQSQQDEIDELRTELRWHQEKSGRKIAETLKDVNQLQESLGDSDGITPTPSDGQNTIQEHDLTPVEQISHADNIDEVIDSPSVKRAVSLFKNVAEWGSRTPKGIVLKSSDNPLSLLSADMDESLCWKQYYRAASALESLSEGAVTFVNSDRHGKMLILHEQSEVYHRMLNGVLSVSSVGAEG